MTDTDITTIVNAIGSLRDDFAMMKENVEQKFNIIQTDIAGIKTEIGNIKTDMETMNEDFNNLAKLRESDMEYIKNCLNALNGQGIQH